MSLVDDVAKLEAELNELRKRPSDWQLKSDLQNTQRLFEDERRLRIKGDEEKDRLRDEVLYYKKALRFQQRLKGNHGRIRHLPGFNEVRRSRLDVSGWTNMERVFLRHWREENKRKPGLNGGNGLLELLLSEVPNSGGVDICQRDATVAATVIQWLGTNCGQGFLHGVRKEYEEIDKKRNARNYKLPKAG